MWRRSWLSREVLFFGLFFTALSLLTAVTWIAALRELQFERAVLLALEVFAAAFGVVGVLASARIYLVPARPAWNTLHTPLDFFLSSAFLGFAAVPLLLRTTFDIHALSFLHVMPLFGRTSAATRPIILAAVLWTLNQVIRTIRLHRSATYEHRACVSVINTDGLRGVFLVSFAFVGLAILFAITGQVLYVLPAALAGVLAARYLFFVSVVPLNMALTFVGSVRP